MLLNRFGIFWRGLQTDCIATPPIVIKVCMQLHNFILEQDKEYADPAEQMRLVVEERQDIPVYDRLMHLDRPRQNANGAPSAWLWYHPPVDTRDSHHSILIRTALMRNLEELKLLRPCVHR